MKTEASLLRVAAAAALLVGGVFGRIAAANASLVPLPSKIVIELRRDAAHIRATNRSIYEVVPDGDAYRVSARCDQGYGLPNPCLQGRVSVRVVTDLVTALRLPLAQPPSAAELGITAAWASARASEVGRHEPWSTSVFDDRRVVDRWLGLLNDYALARQFAHDEYASASDRSEGNLAASVLVEWPDGSRISVSSISRRSLMLPWRVGSQQRPTYEVRISRALSDILPEGALLRERIDGEDMKLRYIWYVWSAHTTEFSTMQADDEYGPAMTAARARVDVLWANAWPDGLDLVLRPRIATNLALLFDLGLQPLARRAVDGVTAGLDRVSSIVRLLNSLSWLKDFTAAHPGWHELIQMRNGVALGYDLPQSLIEYFDSTSRPSVARLIERNLTSAVRVSASGPVFGAHSSMDFIVFSDGSTLVLQSRGTTPFSNQLTADERRVGEYAGSPLLSVLFTAAGVRVTAPEHQSHG